MNNSISSIPAQNPSIIEDIDIRRIYPLVFMTRSTGKYNPEEPVKKEAKFTRRSTSFTKVDSLQDILNGIKDSYLPIVVPGHPQNAARVTVIDIDKGGNKALRKVIKLLKLKSKDYVTTKSRRIDGVHLWVRPKNGDAIGTSQKWEIPSGSGDIIWHRHGVVLWNPTRKLCDFLERVKDGKVRKIDVSALLDAKPSKSKQGDAPASRYQSKSDLPNPDSCPGDRKIAIEKYLDKHKISKYRELGRKWMRQMAASREGCRNDNLNAIAFTCTVSKCNGHHEGDVILRGIKREALKTGLPEDEVLSVLRSACSDGLNQNERRKTGKAGVARLAMEYKNDLVGHFVYYKPEKEWYRYATDLNWTNFEAEERIDEWVNDQVATEIDEGRVKDSVNPATVVSRLKAKLRLPKWGWNADPYLLGLPNGRVWNLKTGKMRQGRADDLIRQTLAVTPREGVAEEIQGIEDYLKQMSMGVAEMHHASVYAWLKSWRGACYIGKSDINQNLLYLYGEGDTGKSTFINTIRRTLGKEYAGTVAGSHLLKRVGPSAHPEYKYEWQGKRFLSCAEMPHGALDAATIKELVTGDEITARPLYGKSVSFEPVANVVFAGNEIPELSGDPGMKKRFTVLPTTPPAKQDTVFVKWITSEKMCEVWAWHDLVSARQIIENPALLEVPVGLKTYSQDMFKEDDSYVRFVEENFIPVDRHSNINKCAFIPTHEIEEAWHEYCARRGWKSHNKLDMGRLRRTLSKLGYTEQERDEHGRFRQKYISKNDKKNKRGMCRGIWHAKWKHTRI